MFALHRIRQIATALLLAQLAAPPWAAEALSLAQALRLAAAQSRQLAAQDALVSAARNMAVAAGQLPDPVLRLGIDNLPITGPDRLSLGRDFMTQRRIGISQELTRAAKRQARTERQLQDAALALAQRQQALANLRRDTALAWLERYYGQQMGDLVAGQIAQARLQTEGAEIAFRTGKGSQADVFVARAAVLGLEDRLDRIERQNRAAAETLARWIGADAQRATDGAAPWRSSRAARAPTTQDLSHYPALAALSAQLAAAQAEVRLAQANAQPDWTLEAGFSQRGPAYSSMVSVGVSVPLQWDRENRQERELAAKLALLSGLRAQYEDLLRASEAETRTLYGDWESGKQRVDRYAQQLLPVARQRTEATLTAYRIGKADLGAVLLARREEIDLRLQALDVELDTARLWARLEYLIPDTTPASQHGEQP